MHTLYLLFSSSVRLHFLMMFLCCNLLTSIARSSLLIGSPVGSMHMRCKLQQLKNGSIENENPTDAEVKKYWHSQVLYILLVIGRKVKKIDVRKETDYLNSEGWLGSICFLCKTLYFFVSPCGILLLLF